MTKPYLDIAPFILRHEYEQAWEGEYEQAWEDERGRGSAQP